MSLSSSCELVPSRSVTLMASQVGPTMSYKSRWRPHAARYTNTSCRLLHGRNLPWASVPKAIRSGNKVNMEARTRGNHGLIIKPWRFEPGSRYSHLVSVHVLFQHRSAPDKHHASPLRGRGHLASEYWIGYYRCSIRRKLFNAANCRDASSQQVLSCEVTEKQLSTTAWSIRRFGSYGLTLSCLEQLYDVVAKFFWV